MTTLKRLLCWLGWHRYKQVGLATDRNYRCRPIVQCTCGKRKEITRDDPA